MELIRHTIPECGNNGQEQSVPRCPFASGVSKSAVTENPQDAIFESVVKLITSREGKNGHVLLGIRLIG
jgi:hypothetical protein